MVSAAGTIPYRGQDLTWRLAPCLLQLAGQVGATWPGVTIYSIGDATHSAQGRPGFDAGTGRATGGTDHLPDSLGRVCAIDVMHGTGGCDAHALFDTLRTYRHPSLSYLELENVAPYTDHKMGCGLYTGWSVIDAGPSTAGAHVHVSALHLPTLADQLSPWTIVPPAPNLPSIARAGDDMLIQLAGHGVYLCSGGTKQNVPASAVNLAVTIYGPVHVVPVTQAAAYDALVGPMKLIP